MNQLRIPGPDGRNLLGFLASIGAFRALAHQQPEVALSWGSDYRPVLHRPAAAGAWDEERLLDDLEAGLEGLADGARFPWNDLTVKPEKFRQHAERALQAASPRGRHWTDFVAGLTCAAAPLNAKGTISDTTELRAIAGGNKGFLAYMKDLEKRAKRQHLCDALFEEWRYGDKGFSLRWDPHDDRRYALRADNPSKGTHNEIPSMWGANRLAFEALACLPTYPTSRGLETTGFPRRSGRQAAPMFHWPLWEPPVTLDSLRALLGHSAITKKDARQLRALGVYAVLSARRFTEGRYRNFAPAEAWPVPTKHPMG